MQSTSIICGPHIFTLNAAYAETPFGTPITVLNGSSLHNLKAYAYYFHIPRGHSTTVTSASKIGRPILEIIFSLQKEFIFQWQFQVSTHWNTISIIYTWQLSLQIFFLSLAHDRGTLKIVHVYNDPFRPAYQVSRESGRSTLLLICYTFVICDNRRSGGGTCVASTILTALTFTKTPKSLRGILVTNS